MEDLSSFTNGLLENAKENITEKKTSTSSTSSLPSARRTSRHTRYVSKGLDGEDDDTEDAEIRGIGGDALAGFSSLQKYRPCNYEFGPAPKETDDINDIRDYYANLNTRQRALQRVVSVGTEPTDYGNKDYGSYNTFGAGRRRSTQMSENRTSHKNYENEDDFGRKNEPQDGLEQPGNWSPPVQNSAYNPVQEQREPHMQMGMPAEQAPPYSTYGNTGYQREIEPDYFDRLSYGNAPQQQQYAQQPQHPGPYGYTQPSYSAYQGVGGYQMGGNPPPNAYNNDAAQSNTRSNNPAYMVSDMDPMTQLILTRARDVYKTTNYHMEDYKKQKDSERKQGGYGNMSYGSGGREDDLSHLRPSPPKQGSMMNRPPVDEGGSMMNSRTRALLNSVKQSTNALADMTVEDETPSRSSGKPPGRQSRFLRKQETSEPIGKEYSPPRGIASLRQMDAQKSPIKDNYVSRLADDVLGESMYPPLDDNKRNNDDRARGYESSYSSLRNRKSSVQKAQDYSFERNPSPPSYRDNYSTQRQNNHDDEDIDAYISNLKQKTSGRDMVKVVSEIEGRRVTPPRISRERDENASNEFGGSRQRRESGRAGGTRDDYSYKNDRGSNYSSNNNSNDYSNQDSSLRSRRGRQDNDQSSSKFTVGNRRDVSTDRTRLRSSSISRRGSFQADSSSDLNGTTSSRNRYGNEDPNANGPFGGSAAGSITSRKQPYARNYSSSNYTSYD